jgi:hypothetical protein
MNDDERAPVTRQGLQDVLSAMNRALCAEVAEDTRTAVREGIEAAETRLLNAFYIRGRTHELAEGFGL